MTLEIAHVGVVSQGLCCRVASQRLYVIIPSFFSPKLTHYVSPEGSIVEPVFTWKRNLEQSSSCLNLASQCHAQPVAIYSNTTHFNVGHIDEVSVHSNGDTSDGKSTRA